MSLERENKIFLGVDAGGTKTAFLLSDENGTILARHVSGSGGFFSNGADGLYNLLEEGIHQISSSANIKKEDITFAGFGFPGYGESESSVVEITGVCEAVIGKGKVCCECDCYLGWSGSLAMEAGINIVAGTGSICYGVNQEGIAARSSGWGAYCDEGSCTWLGAKTIAIYAKQADGRQPRTQLYQLFREHFAIEEDLMFIHRLNHEIANKGAETAKIQMLLKKAYDIGDVNAAKLYREAAKELALSIHAVARKLGMSDSCFKVSYSGGLFRSGDCILQPLAKEVERIGGQLVKPRFSPEEGAVLFAMKSYHPDRDLSEIVFRY